MLQKLPRVSQRPPRGSEWPKSSLEPVLGEPEARSGRTRKKPATAPVGLPATASPTAATRSSRRHADAGTPHESQHEDGGEREDVSDSEDSETDDDYSSEDASQSESESDDVFVAGRNGAVGGRLKRKQRSKRAALGPPLNAEDVTRA